MLGMYVVRLPPEEESHANGYDYDLTDHHMITQEWFHGVSHILIARIGCGQKYLRSFNIFEKSKEVYLISTSGYSGTIPLASLGWTRRCFK